jgi:hypothetical protein
MTPKENTSDLSVSLPLDAYSGAKYLHAYTQTNAEIGHPAGTYFFFLPASFVSPTTRFAAAAAWSLPESSHDARGDVRVGVCGQLGKSEIRDLRCIRANELQIHSGDPVDFFFVCLVKRVP